MRTGRIAAALTRRRVGRIVVAAAAAAALCAGLFYRGYRGLTLGLLNHARHATVGESRNLTFCIRYWLAFMEKLRYDEGTGGYRFPEAAADFDDDFDRGTVAYHRGDFAAAISFLEREIETRGESEERLFWLAMSYLRLAEAENCLARLTETAPASPETAGLGLAHRGHGAQRFCTLPLERHHDRTELSSRAADLFERLLDRYDEEDRLYRWLLSLSAMTIDAFPDRVPERYRIPAAFVDAFYGETRRALAEEYGFLSFEDRAAELGIATDDTGRGVAVEDFDGDGDLDLVTGGSFAAVRYYVNRGGAAGFVDRTAEAGLDGVTQPFVITAADYDDDGWMDLFVARPFDAYRLFRNDRDGTFTDVTAASGLAAARRPEEIAATWVSAWGDVDRDGDLDLFLAQWAFKMPFLEGLMGRPRMDSKLFRNDGGRFVDVTEAYGLEPWMRDQYYIGAAFGDSDCAFDDTACPGRGFPDLYLSSPLRRTSVLLHNVGGRRFERSGGIDRGESGFVAAFVDVDHDGLLDIFQSGFSDARTSTEQTVFGENVERYRSGHSTILLQNAAGGFDERNDFFSGRMPMATMGASYGDLDNDGCFDFYLGTGNPESWLILPNLMYVGKRSGRRCTGEMQNVSMLEGFGTLQKGHGIVFFDFDGDGDQDVYSALGGMWPGDAWPNQLFVNDSQLTNHWVKVRLRGRETNHFGVGARLRVVAVAADGERIVRYAQMDDKTGFGSAPYLAHVGLLDGERIDHIEVAWPVSGCSHRYPAALDKLVVLDESLCSAPDGLPPGDAAPGAASSQARPSASGRKELDHGTPGSVRRKHRPEHRVLGHPGSRASMAEDPGARS